MVRGAKLASIAGTAFIADVGGSGVRVLVRSPGNHCSHDARRLIGERQKRLALGAVEMTAPVFADKEHDKGENETETDGERERYDRHGG